MRVLVVRHFKTQSNAGGHIMGWGDSPRSSDWEQDLIFVAKALRQNGIVIDVIYSSDLGRARETAAYYADLFNLRDVVHSHHLNEINYGVLRHRPKAWVVRNVPEYKTDPDYVFPEGESFRQMRARSVAYLSRLVTRHRSQTILLVVHAGVIRALTCHFTGIEYGQNLKRKVSHRYVGDFRFENAHFSNYNEIGKPSGFITDGIVPLTPPIEEGEVSAGEGVAARPTSQVWQQ